MFRKIANWTFGSVFRTFGRIIAYLMFGIALSYLLSSLDFRITDLFLDRVDALSLDGHFNGSVHLWSGNRDFILTSDNTSDTDDRDFSYSITNTINDYLVIPVTGVEYVWTEYSDTALLQPINVYYDINLKTSNGWKHCELQNNYIVCPMDHNITLTGINFNFRPTSSWSNNTFEIQLSLGAWGEYYTTDTNSIIENQNQNTQSIINQQQNSTNQILDSNTTEADNTGKDFINNFSNNTHGLTGIITAPLTAIQSMASATCTPLVLPLPFTNNKTLTLPCMNQIYSQYFGAFYTMYQGIVLGLISYWVCVRIFGLAKGFKDPEDDKIEVVDL